MNEENIAYLEKYKKKLRKDILQIKKINTEDPVIQKILSYLE